MMRVDAGGEQRAPFQFPNETIAARRRPRARPRSICRSTATRAVVRTTIGDQTSEKTFELK